MDKDVVRNITFDPETYDRLLVDAEENERSFPRHIIWILKQYLEELD